MSRLSFLERLTRNTELVITDTDEDMTYNLRYEGCKTIVDVKQGIFALTNVQPRRQEWTGWPNDTDTVSVLHGMEYDSQKLPARSLMNSFFLVLQSFKVLCQLGCSMYITELPTLRDLSEDSRKIHQSPDVPTFFFFFLNNKNTIGPQRPH